MEQVHRQMQGCSRFLLITSPGNHSSLINKQIRHFNEVHKAFNVWHEVGQWMRNVLYHFNLENCKRWFSNKALPELGLNMAISIVHITNSFRKMEHFKSGLDLKEKVVCNEIEECPAVFFPPNKAFIDCLLWFATVESTNLELCQSFSTIIHCAMHG